MTVKARLIFGDMLLMLLWCLLVLILLMKWSGIIEFIMIAPVLLYRFILLRDFDVIYKWNKASLSLLGVMVILFIVDVVTALLYNIDVHNYEVWPNWHRLLVLFTVLTGLLATAIRIYQDTKFSGIKAEGT